MTKDAQSDPTEAEDIIAVAADRFFPDLPDRKTAAAKLLNEFVKLSVPERLIISNEGD